MAYLPRGAYVLTGGRDPAQRDGAHPRRRRTLREPSARGTPYIVLSNTGERGAAAVAADLGRALGVSFQRRPFTRRVSTWRRGSHARPHVILVIDLMPPGAPVSRRSSDCSNVLLQVATAILDHSTRTTLWASGCRGATLCCTSMTTALPRSGHCTAPSGPGICQRSHGSVGPLASACRAFGKGRTTFGAAVVRRCGISATAVASGGSGCRALPLHRCAARRRSRVVRACLVDSGCHHIDDNHMRRLPVHTVAASVRDPPYGRGMHPLTLCARWLARRPRLQARRRRRGVF